MPAPPRLPGIDRARGVAVLFMVMTHALDGWVAAPDKASTGYRLTRVVANVPAALFLLLAGLGLALGHQRLVARAPAASPPSPGPLARRGLRIVAAGYGVSLLYAAIEGGASPAELLRADILHCIGLSLALCALTLLVPRPGPRAAVLLLLSVAVPLIVAPHLAPQLHGLPAAAAALLVYVPPYSRFPLFPLCAFAVLGVLSARLLARPHPPRRFLALGLAAIAVTALASFLIAALAARGYPLGRDRPTLLLGLVDQSARALAVLLLCLALPDHRAFSFLVPLGQRSLLLYAVHIPLCYGRLARPLAGRLAFPTALAALVALYAALYALVLTLDRLGARRRAAYGPASSGGGGKGSGPQPPVKTPVGGQGFP